MEEKKQKPNTEVSNVEGSPVQQTPSTPNKKLKLKIPIIITSSILFLILIGITAWFLFTMVTSEQKIFPFSTAGWKMLTNDTAGFSFKYPPECTVIENEFSKVNNEAIGGVSLKCPNDTFIGLSLESNNNWPRIFKDNQDYINYASDRYPFRFIFDNKKITVDGVSAISITNLEVIPDLLDNSIKSSTKRDKRYKTDIVFLHNSRYSITLVNPEKTGNQEVLLRKIISTFRFNSPTSLTLTPKPTANPDLIGANWKTYTDTTLGYSYKYPASWYDQNNVTAPCQTCGGSNPGFAVSTKPNSDNLTALEYAQKEVDGANQAFESKPFKILNSPLNISNMDGAVTNGEPGQGTISRMGFITNKNLMYILIAEVDEKIADQIISTFKFTDSGQNFQPSKNNKLSPVLQEFVYQYETGQKVKIPYQISTTSDGKLIVSLTVSNTEPSTITDLTSNGATIDHVSSQYFTIDANVAPSNLKAIANLTEVIRVDEAITPMTGN